MRRFVFFGLVSTGGAVVDFVIGLWLIRNGVGPAAALAAAMVVSATLVYVAHQRHTFADIGTRDLSSRRLAVFLISTGLIYGLRVVVFTGLRALGAADPLALGVALVTSIAVNYTVSRLLIFSGRRSE